jgi:hypothetical protein
MEANELRIGNYVFYRDKDTLLEVSNIGVKGFETINYQGLVYGSCDVNEYNPIPITKEWLLKFGFELTSNYPPEGKMFTYKDIKGYMLDVCIAYQFISVSQNIGTVRIKNVKYIHQLQNLYFYLTGEELTIK